MFLLVLVFFDIMDISRAIIFLFKFEENNIDVWSQFLKDKLLLHTLGKTIKVFRVSFLFKCVLFCLLVYFGDEYTPELFIQKAPYEGKNAISQKIF